jgi:hypothetical protein
MSALVQACRSCFTTLGAAVRFRVPGNRVELHPTPPLADAAALG